jgi:hypothetical protein
MQLLTKYGGKILFAGFALTVMFGLARAADAATLTLSPSSGSYDVGNVITVDIMLNTQGAAVDGVDVKYLNYNPSLLQLIDENTSIAGIQLTALIPELSFTNYGVIASGGKIDFSVVTDGGMTYTNSAPTAMVRMRFNVLSAGTANLTFDYTSGNKLDTNVASAGGDLLTSVTNASYTLAAFDFSLSSGGNKAVIQGQQTTNTITATRVSGTASAVTFTHSGLPTGASASFSPTSCTPTTSCSTTMTITAGASTPTGSYAVTVTGTSGSLVRNTAFTLTVNAANVAPSVNAGVDQTITLPASANLDATVTDDGLPNPPGTFTTIWTKVSGSGTVTFGNAAAIDTTASFSQAGTYVLRITADDSALQRSDDVQITVNPVPDTATPVRSNGTVNGQASGATLPTGTTQATIALTTSDASPPVTCRYSTVAGTAYASMTNTFSTTGGPNHSTVVTGLQNGQSYTYYVRCIDSAPTPNANTTDNFNINFSVAAPPPDFSMSVSNTTPSVIRGQSVVLNVDTLLVSGSPGSVSFSIPAAEIPTGVSPTFNPTACTPSCQSQLTIDTTTSASIGSYSMTVVGTSAAVTRTSPIDLDILPRKVDVLDLTVSLEALPALSQVSSKTFTVTVIDPVTSNTVVSWSAQPSATTGVLSQPVGNDFDEGLYDVRIVAPGYLSRLLAGSTVAPGSSFTVPQLLSGDLNNDNIINTLDWGLMNNVWFTNDPVADINKDGLVNSIDFGFMNKNWGLLGE